MAVLADGTVLELGGKQIKDASGLSLKQLLIGSEGTLAVITRCTLALLPKPETSLSVLVPYPDLDTGIRSVLAVLQAGANPTAVEFLERSVVELGEAYSGSKYPRPDAGSYLLLTFDGRRVLFTADSDYLHEDFSRLADTPLYAVFLNPLFYQAYYNTRLFHGHFDTDTLCVYHVPFPEDDGMHMQDMARRMPRGAADSGLRVLPLTEPMQQIEL